jgi:hypothetical protein
MRAAAGALARRATADGSGGRRQAITEYASDLRRFGGFWKEWKMRPIPGATYSLKGAPQSHCGSIFAFYGTAASCQMFILHADDYLRTKGSLAGQPNPEAALWATSPQSGTIYDWTGLTKLGTPIVNWG